MNFGRQRFERQFFKILKLDPVKIKKYFLIAIFLLATGSILCVYKGEMKFDKLEENSQIKISINTEFSNYVLGQKIWIRAVLTNNSDSNFFLKEDFGSIGIRLEIIDPNNSKAFNAMQIHIMYTDSTRFIPGETLEAVFPIDNYVNQFNNIEGVYQMRAIFQKIPSNIVNFIMKSPTGDDQQQYVLFMKFTNIREVLKVDLDEGLSSYLDFLGRFPDGPYSPDFFNYTLIAHLMSRRLNKVEDIVSDYFKNNYNSYTSRFIVGHYFTYLTKDAGYSKVDALSKIDSLSLIYNSSESARIIKNFIKETSDIK